MNNGGGSSPCNTDAIFIVFNISFSSAIALLFRHACPPQEQPLDPRPHCLLINELTTLLLIFCRFACHSQHPPGSWYLRCMVFPRQYRAVVHWIRGPSSVSESTQITLLSLLFELSIYTCHVISVRCCKAWDIHPVLKNVFFFSDSRFVIRAKYLPSLFQPLPR